MTTFATPAPDPTAAPDNDFRRNHNGWPIIGQLDGSKPKAYRRCSAATKQVEDTYGLERWQERNVAYGMTYDSSLGARVLAIQGNPSTWEKAEKDAVNGIVTDAKRVAKSQAAADIGTAVHRLTERVDMGEAVIAGAYAGDLAAYTQALANGGVITHPQWIECRMVNDDLEMAGTADRLVTFAPGSPCAIALETQPDEVTVADVKTGGSVDFLGLSAAGQLASYAGGLLYDPVSDTRQPTPVLNRRWGLIIHLPAGTGTCGLYKVDLVAGLAACHLANAVKTTRNRSKGWLTPVLAGGTA